MTENNEALAPEKVTTTVPANDTSSAKDTAAEKPEYSDTELKAMDRGWKPRDQYEGDDWRPAKEFLDRGELLNTISKLSKENREIKDTLTNVEDHMDKWTQHVREQTIRELQANKRDAIQSGDVERVEQIDAEIDKRKQDENSKPGKNASHQPLPEAVDFVKRNSAWYNTDTPENIEMMAEARRIDQLIVEQNPGIPPAEALAKVETYIRKKFSDRFKNPNRYQPREVETTHQGSGISKKKYNPAQITEGMRHLARDFVKRGVFKTEEAYYEQLQQIGELN